MNDTSLAFRWKTFAIPQCTVDLLTNKKMYLGKLFIMKVGIFLELLCSYSPGVSSYHVFHQDSYFHQNIQGRKLWWFINMKNRLCLALLWLAVLPYRF